MRRSSLHFLLLIFIITACWQLGQFFRVDLQHYRNLITSLPIYFKGLFFIFLYSSVSFFIWPAKDLFKILGAVLFGAYISTLFIWLAEIINATVLFHLARKLGRTFVEEKLTGRWRNLDQKIQSSGFWGLFALRIVPLVPFRFLDLAVGLTKIPFRNYLAVVCLASPLRIFWIQFILAAIGEQLMNNFTLTKLFPVMMEYLQKNQIVFAWSFAYLIAAIFLTIWVRKKLKT